MLCAELDCIQPVHVGLANDFDGDAGGAMINPALAQAITDVVPHPTFLCGEVGAGWRFRRMEFSSLAVS